MFLKNTSFGHNSFKVKSGMVKSLGWWILGGCNCRFKDWLQHNIKWCSMNFRCIFDQFEAPCRNDQNPLRSFGFSIKSDSITFETVNESKAVNRDLWKKIVFFMKISNLTAITETFAKGGSIRAPNLDRRNWGAGESGWKDFHNQEAYFEKSPWPLGRSFTH